MSESIGPKIEVKGEKEFRDAIGKINQDMKTLGTEMKLATSSFDANEKSVESLTAKNKVLEKQIETQKDKVKVLKDALESASKEYGESDTKTKKWQQSLNLAQADLNKMEKELKNSNDAIEEFSKTTEDSGDGLEEMADGVEDFGDNAKDTEKKSLSLGDVIKANLISDAIIGGIKGLGSAMKSAVTSIADGLTSVIEDTKDYRKELSLLEQNATDSGVSFDGMKDKLSNLTAITGDSGASVEALSNLMATGFDDAGMTQAVDALSGAVVKFPDTMKIEGLADGLQETLATGEATGAFSELIGRMGGNVEEFNKSLAGCTTEAEKQQVALDWLAQSGLAGVNQAYQDQNSAVISAEEAQFRYNDALASLADSVQPVVSTLQGDLAGVMTNLVGVITGDKDAVDNLGASITTLATDAVTAITNALPQIQEMATTVVPIVIDAIVQALPSLLETGVELISTIVGAITDNLPMILDAGMDMLMTIVQAIIDNLPSLIETGLEVILALANGIAESLPDLIPTLVDTVITIVETLIDNVDMLIDAAIEIIMALAEGLINSLPKLIEKGPVIIEKLITAITENLPKILKMGIDLILELAKGLIQAIPQIVSKTPTIITSIVKGLKEGLLSLKDVGKYLVEGLWSGISNMTSWIKDKIKGFGSSVVDGLKDFFGIHSPSKLMEDEVGTYLAQGVGEGFVSQMETITRDMSNSMPTSFDDLDVNINRNVNTTHSNNIDSSGYPINIQLNPEITITGELAKFFQAFVKFENENYTQTGNALFVH